MATETLAPPASRVVMLDAVRGVAIVCMLIAHGVPFLYPTGVPGALTAALAGINDVASPLFGLAMGASAALVWARPAVTRHWPRRIGTDAARGVVLFILGMMLVELHTWVAIVLHVLGVLMILGVPVAALAGAVIRSAGALAWMRWLLAGVTASLFLLAPWVTGALAPAEDRIGNGMAGGWHEVWIAVAAGHNYRALSLLPFFALGALLATTGWLTQPRALGMRCLPAGAVLLVAGWLGWLGQVELSGDVADQWRDLALVLTALGLTGILAGLGTLTGMLTSTLADLGAIALSLYAVQLVVLRPMMEWSVWTASALWGWVCLGLLVLGPSAAVITWRRALGPGPLERLVALVTGKRHAT